MTLIIFLYCELHGNNFNLNTFLKFILLPSKLLQFIHYFLIVAHKK